MATDLRREINARRPAGFVGRDSLGRAARGLLLVGPGLAFLSMFFFVPIGLLFARSLHRVDFYNRPLSGISLHQYTTAFGDPYYSQSLVHTFYMAIEAATACVVLAYPAAYALANARSRVMRSILYTIIVSPLLTSVVVRTFGWIVLLSSNGPINHVLTGSGLVSKPVRMLYTYPATLIAVIQVLLPFAVLPLASALSAMSPDLRRASAVLGARRDQTFARVVFPILVPAFTTAFLLVFSIAVGLYVTPLLVGGNSQPLAAIRVYLEALQLANIPASAALSFILLGLSLVVVAGIALLTRRYERRLRRV